MLRLLISLESRLPFNEVCVSFVNYTLTYSKDILNIQNNQYYVI
jgi:hypothetical protein